MKKGGEPGRISLDITGVPAVFLSLRVGDKVRFRGSPPLLRFPLKSEARAPVAAGDGYDLVMDRGSVKDGDMDPRSDRHCHLKTKFPSIFRTEPFKILKLTPSYPLYLHLRAEGNR